MLSVFIRTILIYVILNILLKIMGKRQIGELEANELVCALLISEIASISIADVNVPFLFSLIPILFIFAAEILTSAVKNRSNTVKKIIEGTPSYIIYKGKLLQKNLKKNRISINEILTEMRTQSISDISEVYYAILEQNGKLSLFKKSDGLAHSLIIDGEVLKESVDALSLPENFIKKQLEQKKLKRDDVFLLTVNDDGKVNIIEKEENK